MLRLRAFAASPLDRVLVCGTTEHVPQHEVHHDRNHRDDHDLDDEPEHAEHHVDEEPGDDDGGDHADDGPDGAAHASEASRARRAPRRQLHRTCGACPSKSRVGTGPNGVDRTRSRLASSAMKPASARALAVSRSQWHPWWNRDVNGVAIRWMTRFAVPGGAITWSMNTTRPPGTSTRRTSASVTAWSATEQSTYVPTTASTECSGSGIR